MRLIRGIGKFFWRFMVIFSFIVNLVLIVILLAAGLFIFQIKAQVADPLIGGLHSTAAGLGEATIDWVIPVRDDIPIDLLVPINANTITSEVTQISGEPVNGTIPGETVVELTRPVPITINNAFIQSNDLTLRNATVNITLPAGTQLPVALNMEVQLVTDIPVALDVRAVIPLEETQLIDPIEELGLLFEPLAIGLHNLPNNFSEGGDFVLDIWRARGAGFGDFLTTLLLSADGNGFNEQPYDAWDGYSRTAGLNYELADQLYPPHLRALETGIVVPGGIPALDALLPRRAVLYDGEDTPATVTERAITNGAASQLPPQTWDGSFSDYFANVQQAVLSAPTEDTTTVTEDTTTTENPPAVGGSDQTGTDQNANPEILPTPSQ